MKYTTWPSMFSFMMSLIMLFFVLQAILEGQFDASIFIFGIALVFFWFGFNSKSLTTNLFSSQFKEQTNVEKSKYSQLLFTGILCLPLSFLIRLIEWL